MKATTQQYTGGQYEFFTRICMVVVIFTFMFSVQMQAIHPNFVDSIKLQTSLVTCAPGNELYTLFGHTAIRIQELDSASNVERDFMFNYGAFNYNADKFIYRFLRGETDYILSAEPSDMFIARYAAERCRVIEQELNFTELEKIRLYNILLENYRPENRTYRYSWLYNNCTNRAKEVIEQATEGRVEYKLKYQAQTARQILRRYTCVDSWISMGIDFILGSEIDTILSKDAQMFIPEIYCKELTAAVIIADNGQSRPLLSKETVLVEGNTNIVESSTNWALIVLAVIAVLILIVVCVEIRRKKTYKWLDVVICAIVGLVGILITFFFFCSEHPGMSTNWWVIIFNPIPLIFVPYIIKRKTKYIYLIALTGFVAGLITMRCMHQDTMTSEFVILAFILLIRIIENKYLSDKLKK